MTQVAGRHTSLTFASALRPGGRAWLRLLFWAARRLPAVTAPLRPLEAIHFLRWTIVDRLPGAAHRLHPPLLLFESDFDGDLPLYIDTFAEVLPWRMRAVWSTSYGNPGLIPTDGFHRWVVSLEASAGYFHTATPGASASMVRAALSLQEALDGFAPAVDLLDDDAFVAAYERFLGEVQQWVW